MNAIRKRRTAFGLKSAIVCAEFDLFFPPYKKALRHQLERYVQALLLLFEKTLKQFPDVKTHRGTCRLRLIDMKAFVTRKGLINVWHITDFTLQSF